MSQEQGEEAREAREALIVCFGCVPRWMRNLLPKALEWVGPEKCIGCGLNPSIIMGKYRSRVWVIGVKAVQYQGGAVAYLSLLGAELRKTE